MPLGQRLRLLRGDRSQREIAEALKVTRSAYSMYEIGERTPDDALLVRMADYFGVTTDYLLGRTQDPTWPGAGHGQGHLARDREPPFPVQVTDEQLEAILRERGLSQDDIELVRLLEEKRRRTAAKTRKEERR